MPGSDTVGFWIDHLKANTLMEAIGRYPSDARKFFGEFAFDIDCTPELAMLAYSYYVLSLSDRELLAEIASHDVPSGPIPAESEHTRGQTGTFRANEQVFGPGVNREPQSFFEAAYSDPRVQEASQAWSKSSTESNQIRYRREVARAYLRVAGVGL